MRSTVIPSLVLASASPRRKELLERIGLALEVLPADLDESRHPNEEPIAYARRLAAEKVRAVAERISGVKRDRPVLGADTIVIVDDGGDPVLGKPAGPEEARVMLTRLSGRSHLVATAYHLFYRGAERGRAVETEVTFRPLLPVEVEGYVGAREWEGKAGGYAIQGLAGAFVRRIHGSYTNVVGLPLCEVVEDLDALGALPPDWTLGKP